MTVFRPPFGTALGGLVALAAGMGIGRFVYTPILPFMAEDLGLSPADSGVIASANFLGYLAGALAAARMTTPGGRRRWLLAALALSAATTAAMAATASTPAFLALRFAGGMASAYVIVLAAGLALDRLAAAGRTALSWMPFAGVGTGIAVSALLVTGLAFAGAGWRALWLASGGVAVLALAACVCLIAHSPEDSARGPAPPGRGGGVGRAAGGFPALVAAYGLFGFGYVITATFISQMVRTSPEVAALEGVVWLAVGLAAAPSVAFWTWCDRRFGSAAALASACTLEGIGIAASVFEAEPAAVIAAAVLLGGTFMGITALGLTAARRMVTGDPTRILALMTASFGVGQVIGPTFAGYAYRIGDSFLVPSLAAAAALFAAAVLTARLR